MINKFTRNIYHTKDDWFHDLNHLRYNQDIALLAGDCHAFLLVNLPS